MIDDDVANKNDGGGDNGDNGDNGDLPSSLSGETNWWQILGRGSYKYYHYKRELYFIWFSFIKVSTFSFMMMFLQQLTQS